MEICFEMHYLNDFCMQPVRSLFQSVRMKGSCDSPVMVKLKSGGSSRPLGRRVPGWRSSSKKPWAQAWSGDSRVTGVYSKSREHRAIASGGVLGLNTCGNYIKKLMRNERKQHKSYKTASVVKKINVFKISVPTWQSSTHGRVWKLEAFEYRRL